MAKLKIGIIGTGAMGNTHARRYRELRGVDLHACYDVDTSRALAFAKDHGVQQVASSVKNLIDDCDAVSVVTPDRFHAPICIKTMNAGKHLLCEKPLTTTLSAARRVARRAVEAQRRDGARHMVNFSYRDSSAVQEAIKIVRRGDLGALRHVHAHYLQSWLIGQTVWGHWQDDQFLWRLQTSQGSLGVLGDLGSHLLDLVTVVAGDVDSLDCSLTTFPKIDRQGRRRSKWDQVPLDANDTAIIRLNFSSGAMGICHTTRWATGQTNSVSLSVHGTDGGLRVDLDEGYDKLFLCQGWNRAAAKWKTRTMARTPSVYQRFVRSIRTGKPDQPDVVRGAQVQSFLDACQRSAENQSATTKIRKWI